MLEHTFIHAEGVGPTTERRLWSTGSHTWDAFLRRHEAGELSPRLRRLAPFVEQSRQALEQRDLEFFSRSLPPSEMWRLFGTFGDQAAYLDIETTGFSADYDEVTVIGLYDGTSFRAFVRGHNLMDFPRAVARCPLLVSYNGSTFDLPFLRRTFPSFAPRAHLDLRYPLRRLGYDGGLKDIERTVGIRRPPHLRDVDGSEAIFLWHQYRRGRAGALQRLIEYTQYDVMNLVMLAERVATEMPNRIGAPARDFAALP